LEAEQARREGRLPGVVGASRLPVSFRYLVRVANPAGANGRAVKPHTSAYSLMPDKGKRIAALRFVGRAEALGELLQLDLLA
jgi:hypothetical protein